MTSARLVSLDLIRGVAAIVVCLQHLRHATFLDYSQVQPRGPFEAVFYFATGLGHEAVMVFFVLSGYFVGGAVVRAGNRFDAADFAVARVTRLWCVLVPCLALTWLVDRWLAAHAPGVLDGGFAVAWHSAPPPGTYDGSWPTALGNLFFLQTVFVPVYGSNGPLWSLAYEAWYYLLFPLAWVALEAGGPASTKGRVAAALAAVLLVLMMPAPMRGLFAVWLLGVGVHGIDQRGTPVPRLALWLSGSVFLATLAVVRLHRLPAALEPLSDPIVGLTFAVFCLALIRHDARIAWPRPVRRLAFWLSDISFSLYLSHFSLVLAIGAALYVDQRLRPDAQGLALFAGWLALLLAAGHGMWWCFERRTPALRARLIGLFHLDRRPRPVDA